MRWRITEISGKDFGSFKEFKYSFDQSLYLVRGTNLDVDSDGSHVSNGSGKTSFIDAIPLCLFGISIANRKPYTCIRNGYPYFQLGITLKKGEDTLYVERRVYRNTSPTDIVVRINGDRPKHIVTRSNSKEALDVSHAQSYIYDVLGLSKELILSYFCIGSNSYTPFPLLGEKARLDTINLISGATHIDGVIELYKQEVREIEKEKESNEHKFSSLRSLISGTEEKIKADELSFVDRQQEDLKRAKTEKEKGKLRIKELEKSQKDSTGMKEKLNIRKKEISDKLVGIEETILKVKGDNLEIKRLGEHLKESISCPSCGDSIVIGLKDTRINIEKRKKELEEEFSKYDITAIKEELDRNKSSLSKCEEEIYAYASKEGRVSAEFSSLKKEQLRLSEEEEHIRKRESPFKELRKDLDAKKAEASKTFNAIGKTETNLLLTERRRRTIEGFRRYLSNKTLSYVQVAANRILKNLSSPFIISIERLKKLRSKETRQSINPIILRGGSDRTEYSFLSRGEQGVINIAFDLALRDVVNTYSKSGLDFYCNDEKLNVIDESGISSITQSFGDKKEGLMLLCTHSAPTTNFRSEIKVQKSRGISEIVV